MGIVHAIILGIVQGLTEYLPISSNAHIRLAMILLHESDKQGAAFTAVIQLGTVLAVLIYFWKDIVADVGAWAKSLTSKGSKNSPEARMGWAVFWGTLPVIGFGVLLKHQVETNFRSLYFIAFAFIGMGIVMFAMDRFGKNNRKTETVTVLDGIIVGLFQVLALIPGMSRSGSTIAGCQSRGFDRASAAKFSFLMAIPSVTGAGIYEAYKARHDIHGMLVPILAANVASFVVGYASIAFLMQFLRKYGVGPFVLYRIILGVLILGLLQSGSLKANEGAEPEATQAKLSSVYLVHR